MRKLMLAALAGIALGLLLTGSALANCASCGDRHSGGQTKCGCPSRGRCQCKSKSRSCCWGDQGSWYKCSDGCCAPQADTIQVCVPRDGCYRHPYEACFNGSSLLCDTGCSSYLPCKRVGVFCETKCQEHVCKTGCGCEQVSYTTTQECHEIERPRVVPWWFSGGKGNVYLDNAAPAVPMVADQAGGSKMAGAAGSPEKKAGEPAAPATDSAATPEKSAAASGS